MDMDKARDLINLVPETFALPLAFISIALFLLLFPRGLSPALRIVAAVVLVAFAIVLFLLTKS